MVPLKVKVHSIIKMDKLCIKENIEVIDLKEMVLHTMNLDKKNLKETLNMDFWMVLENDIHNKED